MQVTVLGKSPSWADLGGACTGYLVRADGYALLLDCGSGVFGKLRGVIDYLDLDAVLITHLHADHYFDLVPFSYALRHGPRSPEPGGVRLLAPPGAREVFRATVGAYSDEPRLIESVFDLAEYDPAAPLELGPLRARFCEVPHFTRTYAVELASEGRRFTFGADCGPNEAIVRFARDTDLLLLEATQLHADGEAAEDRGHLTAREAGEHGRRAGARRLVLTHYSDELDAGWARAQAGEAFGNEVELAEEGIVYTV
jgi:ribonuclease BN (tRNA processing enzyme)